MRLLKLSALCVLVLFSAVGILGLLAVRSLPAAGIGGAGGQVASTNGDVNCDGRLDLTDAVYVLEHLFRGGQEPCALAQGGPGFPEVVGQLERLNGSVSLIAGQVGGVLASKWPPRPQDIVNLSVTDIGSPIFTVPVDRFLVVTDLNFLAGGNGVSLELFERRDSQTLKLRLSGQPTLTTDTTQLGIETVQWHSAVGLVFSPGSEVVAKAGHQFQLVGYLASTSL